MYFLPTISTQCHFKILIMQTTTQIAKHLRDVFFGGNWTCSDFKKHLAGVTWQDATTPIYGLNTIAKLAYHVHYYVLAQIMVLKENKLEASDKFSFDHPPIAAQSDWDDLVEKILAKAEELAALIENLSDEQLNAGFIDPKYGNYYRNFAGMIEHCHYHLGQLVIIKKIIAQKV